MKKIKSFGSLFFLLFWINIAIFSQEIPAYNYDKLYRLIQITHADGSITLFQYDAVGNRTRKITTNEVTLPLVETSIVTEISSVSAIVGGIVTISGGSNVNERGVYWGTSPNPETTGWVLQAGSGLGEFSIQLTGLSEETTYYVKAFATNNNGTAWGEERLFTTLATVAELFTLQLTANPTEGGNVTGGGSYEAGSLVSLQATPNLGYFLLNWTNQQSDIISTSESFTYTMPAENSSLTANFSNDLSHSISGKLFNDLNTNGIYDPGEDALLTVISDWSVHLDGPVSSTVTPNSDGSYQFSGLPSGDYSIHLSVPDHWTVINPFFSGVHHINTMGKQNFANTDFACFNLQRSNSDMEVIQFPNGQRTGNNSLTPTHPDAPNQSPSLTQDDLAVNSIHLNISATGFEPDTIFVHKDYITQLVLSSTDNYTHVIMFDDEALSAIAVGVSPQETRMMTFKTYNVIEGQFYDFHCDVPGHAGRGEVGTMYILGGLNTLPIVQTNNPAAITASGALVGGNVLFSESNPVIERGVYWSTTPNPETTGSVLQAGSGLGEFAVALTGLSAETTYYVKAYATNANGTAYGEERQFTTLATVPELFTLQLTANPPEGGNVTGGGSYEAGSLVSLQATPSQGYFLLNWTNQQSEIVSTTESFTYTMPAENSMLTANFSNDLSHSISGKLFNDLNTNGIFDPGADALLTAINDWVVHIDGPITSSVTPNSDGSYQFSDLPAGDYSLHLSVPVHWTVINPFFDGVHHISTLGKQNFENIDFACFYLQRDNSEMEVIHFPNGQRTGDNSLLPLHPDAPNQSSPIDSEQLPAHSIHLQVSATGFDPDTIFVYKDYIAQLALSSTDNYTHVIMFDDEALSSIAIGVSPQETRMMTFKTYNVVEGQFYDFHCDVPGHAGRGEVGTMYILGGLNTLPIVQTNNPVAITASGALVGGNVLFSESNPVIERGVYWSTTPNPETTGSVLQAGSGLGEFAVALTGLTSQTTYYVKAFATNANGTAYGEERQFETLEETNCTPGWSPTPNLQYNMQVVAQLLIDGQISLNPNDVVGAFVGEECRGMASPSPDFEGLVFLTVSSNVASGEQVQLKIWNSNDCRACDAIPGFAFENQSELGNYLEPYQVRCGAIQEVAFGQGFTWFSLNVNPGSMTPTSLFADLTPCYDDRVIGQTSFALFTGTNWIGSLTQLGVEKSYRMKLCSAQDISLMGEAAALNPVSLAAGYTWLGYQPQQCQSMNAAMAGLSPGPSYDDRVIGQSSFALYTGSQWIGSLTQMCPGAGYVIKLANAQTLTYPAATSKDSPVVNETLISPTGIYPAEHQQHSMMVVGKLMLEDGTVSINEKDMIYASIDGEIRGMAQPMADNDGLIFLSIGSDEEVAQPISFMLWLDERQELLPLNETLSFEPLAAIGELNNPFIFTLGEMVGLGETTNGIWIGEAYPNPFTERTTIPYFLNEAAVLKFSIYDSRGLLVKAAQTVAADKGHHQYSIESVGLAKGVYMLEVQISGKSLVHNKIIRLVIN